MNSANIPRDDAGAQTAGWYRYQYAVTAAECLDLFSTGGAVVVEWHTDYIVEGSVPRLVSVKHREASQGPWTLAALCANGALSVLRQRWIEGGKKNSCELRTNAGFSPAKDDARSLATALVEKRSAHLPDALISRLSACLACTPDETLEFLSSLALLSTGGDAGTIDGVLVENAVRPMLEVLGVDADLARKAYRVALDLVAEVAADCTTSAGDWATWPAITPAVREKRTIDAARVHDALEAAGVHLGLGVVGGIPHAPNTRLVRKLRAGGLGPTVVASAPRLRNRWFNLEAAFRDDLPGRFGDAVAQTRSTVLGITIDAEVQSLSDTPYGNEMMRLVRDRLAAGLDVALPLEPTDLLGCAYQLTDECSVWWSERFDPVADAPWVVP